MQTAAHAVSSKRYGSGTTAAQIANGNGAPAGTPVLGPGNSQPHKVTNCKHKHAVDVHAVKSYSSTACSGSSSTTTSVTATGSVAGTTATGTSATATMQKGGVLGAIQAVGQGSLPFTGFPLWIAFIASLGVIALGLTLRRQARVTK